MELLSASFDELSHNMSLIEVQRKFSPILNPGREGLLLRDWAARRLHLKYADFSNADTFKLLIFESYLSHAIVSEAVYSFTWSKCNIGCMWLYIWF